MDLSTSDQSFSFPRIFLHGQKQIEVLPQEFSSISKLFEQATGWVLDFKPSENSQVTNAQTIQGEIAIVDMSATWPAGKNTASREKCDSLASAISHLVQELQAARTELEHYKANDPFHAYPGINASDITTKSQIVAQLIEFACEISHTQDAGLYLLNDEGNELILRATCGQSEQWTNREVRSENADVQAMNSGPLTMGSRIEVANYTAPINCQSAVCVPVSVGNQVLGTLWICSGREQKYSEQIVQVLSIIAGKLAAEIVLGASVGELQEQADCKSQPIIPDNIALPFDGWDVQVKQGSTSFSQWAVTSDEQLLGFHAKYAAEDPSYSALFHSVIEAILQNECSSQEAVEAAQLIVGEIPGLEMACAIVDPLTGEVDVTIENGDSETPLATLSGGFAQPKQLSGNYRSFLKPGQAIIFGGIELDHDILSTITPDFESVIDLLSAADGELGSSQVVENGRMVLGRV